MVTQLFKEGQLGFLGLRKNSLNTLERRLLNLLAERFHLRKGLI